MADSKIAKPYDGTKIPKFFRGYLYWDSTNACFPVTILPSSNDQITYVVRNNNNGGIYACWYNSGKQGFEIGGTISGNAPANEHRAYFEYSIK